MKLSKWILILVSFFIMTTPAAYSHHQQANDLTSTEHFIGHVQMHIDQEMLADTGRFSRKGTAHLEDKADGKTPANIIYSTPLQK